MILTYSCIFICSAIISYKLKQLSILYTVKRLSGASIYSTYKYLFNLLFYIQFVRRVNKFKSNVIIHKKYYDVTYRLPDGNSYVLKIKRSKRGPNRRNVKLYNKGLDITKTLKKYLGPNNDFHGLKYTPSVLGYDHICVRTDLDESFWSVDIKSNEIIRLS
jgi:hypothetical protein